MSFLEQSLQSLDVAEGIPNYENLPEDYDREYLRLEIGSLFYQLGEINRGREIFSEVLPDISNIVDKARVLTNTAYQLFQQEESAEAIALLQESEQLALQVSNDMEQGSLLFRVAEVYAQGGNNAAAQQLLPMIDRLYEAGAFEYHEEFTWRYVDLLQTFGAVYPIS